MSNMQLANLTLNALVALHNGAVDDYAPEGFEAVKGFKSKAKAIEAIENMCEAGSLAVSFDGDDAVIVDAMESGDDAGDDAAVVGDYGDGKGEVAKSGFRYASEDWLKDTPRGSAEREAYRKARRKAARAARKAKAAALETVNEE